MMNLILSVLTNFMPVIKIPILIAILVGAIYAFVKIRIPELKVVFAIIAGIALFMMGEFAYIFAIIVGIILVCIYMPNARPAVAVSCIVLTVILGGISAYYNVKYLTTKSMTIGQVFQTAFKTTEIEEEDSSLITTWTFTNVAFTYENGVYKATKKTEGNTAFDFENKTYSITVNNEKCFITENGGSALNPYVKSRFLYTFYDENEHVILTDTLYINFTFHTLETEVILSTYGGENAVNMWQAFKAKNGLVISLVEDTLQVENSNEIQVDNHIYTLSSGLYECTDYNHVFNFDFEEFKVIETWSNNSAEYTFVIDGNYVYLYQDNELVNGLIIIDNNSFAVYTGPNEYFVFVKTPMIVNL